MKYEQREDARKEQFADKDGLENAATRIIKRKMWPRELALCSVWRSSRPAWAGV